MKNDEPNKTSENAEPTAYQKISNVSTLPPIINKECQPHFNETFNFNETNNNLMKRNKKKLANLKMRIFPEKI